MREIPSGNMSLASVIFRGVISARRNDSEIRIKQKARQEDDGRRETGKVVLRVGEPIDLYGRTMVT